MTIEGKYHIPDRVALKAYSEGKFIVTYKGVYQIMYSVNQMNDEGKWGGVYGSYIAENEWNLRKLVKRGTYEILTAEELNKKLGYEFFFGK